MYFAGCVLAWATLSHAAQPRYHRRQWDDPPEDSYKPDCTFYSFTNPLWRIYDPTFIIPNATKTGQRTEGHFWFTAHNLAINVQTECEIKSSNLYSNETRSMSESSWHTCKDNSTQFRMSLELNEFQLRGSWECTEPPKNIKFAGIKKWRMPVYLGCQSDKDETGNFFICYMGNFNLEPTLTTPIQLDIITPSWPFQLYYTADTCGERSEIPAWTITDLDYNHTALDKASALAGLSFSLRNVANFETLACTIRVDETALDRSLSEPWVDCSSTSGSGNFLSTKILFSRQYNMLAINQTWRCPDGSLSRNGEKTFNGVGYLELPLNCTAGSADTYGAPHPYSCSMAETNLTGYSNLDFMPQVPHTYYSRSCTVNSINVTAMTLREYEVDAAARTANLRVFNPGPAEEYRIRLVGVQADGGWHVCDAGKDSLPWQLVSCQYQLAEGKVGLKVQWYCDDRNPYTPILISATASGQLGSGGEERTLNVSSLSWNTTSEPMDRGLPLPWV